MTQTHGFATRAVHAGRDDLAELGVHAVPIDLSTTYPAVDCALEAARIEEFAAGRQPEGSPIYQRLHNPTVARFEAALAELEGAEAGVAFASGMAAMSACLLAVAAAGKPHVVAVRPLYGGSDHLLGSGLLGTSVTWVDADGVAGAIRPDTGLVVVETPANPTLTELDLAELSRAAGAVPLLADNTFATPVLQRPIEHGASIVLHSATKFLGGHGDVLGGIVACDEAFARRVRQIRVATGGIMHPLAAYLLVRGLSTLPVRVKAAQASAHELALRLREHPAVGEVHYPGLAEGRPGQMSGGGALVAFATPNAAKVVAAVELITPAVSLGSVDTLIQHPSSLTHRVVGEADRHAGGIGEDLLRISVGLEDVEDLWADLAQALDRS
ncbi:cystathionine gamma-synthase [Actinorhabdospora filicis]|uniref:homocysteine desulfhydrase n=1 Tax=Actinorhabdospora filicis TaxID=1785913 RepID=A0A9W6SNS4_9ACTN|nr:PLP-dependent aspartate aminotransferase family protein [Actinorhabdospora filicis]GLZ79351.1 cystathionine gamma-synthase [Actinorhabdospora filicis]